MNRNPDPDSPPASKASSTSAQPSPPVQPAPLTAVIDIGTKAIRMTVAEIRPGQEIHELESLRLPVNLGQETFTRGRISRETIEVCVDILNRFKQKLAEYGLRSQSQLSAVATTAVREASNRDAFVDRLHIATGINVDILEESEARRIIYMSLRPRLEAHGWKTNRPILVVEVGSGVTELLVIQDSRVTFSQTYRLGGVRMLAHLPTRDRRPATRRAVLATRIEHVINWIEQDVPNLERPRLIVLGSDAELAAETLEASTHESGMLKFKTARLPALVDDLLGQSPDDLVRQYKITLPDAETLAPVLLALERIAMRFDIRTMHCTSAGLRSGLLVDLAEGGKWRRPIIQQIKTSAIDIGQKFQFDQAHAEHVAGLCDELFQVLRPLHGLGMREQTLLHLAGLLHEIGQFISASEHHKHSAYLIQHSEIFGLNSHETKLVALLSRYHRRAVPKPSHTGYAGLPRSDRRLVSKLAAILRTADALDRSYQQRIQRIRCRLEKDILEIGISGVPDLSIERLAMKEKAGLLRQIFGLSVKLVETSPAGNSGSA